ncbi:hypothetical protein RvY_01201 [Ramazzottius varieornatus]|uniref:GH18 domain-containing protein n=1 Tax=Ramazzottius varieornatus TaxID=947166 RepID=A0A1D1UFG7_RAMVA|nr:hypothetical protein RvY_01201 [Ramazzottius varieornatus]
MGLRHLILLLLAGFCGVVVEGKFEVQCYLPGWTLNNGMYNPFKVADINPYGPCDIIVYAFFNVNQTRISPPDGNKYRGHFAQLYSLKEINPELKLVLSVGGWNNSDEFVAMAKNGASRSLFAASIVADLRKWSFDGVDIDWEYPEPENAQDYLSLLQDLKAAIVADAERTKRPRLILTAAVGNTVRPGYKAAEMAKYLDCINVMTYDYHGMWGAELLKTGSNAGFPDVEKSMLDWIAAGVPRESLSMGLAFYGRTWTLSTPEVENRTERVGNSALGVGTGGFLTHENGTLSYGEICSGLKAGWTRKMDPVTHTPYAFFGNQWVSYDDSQSLEKKVQWAQNNRLQGVFIWHIGSDDLQGYCGPKFPLLKSVSEILGRPNVIPTLPPKPVAPPYVKPVAPVVASASAKTGLSQLQLFMVPSLIVIPFFLKL